ncbi:MAG: maltotransferase domain-containing protein, partial [Candidatus Limnocylindria bacterium]
MTTTRASLRRAIATVAESAEPDAAAIGSRRTIIIERIAPELDGGRYPVKRVVGDQLLVTADIFADGHDLLDAALLLRADDETAWRRAPMRPIDNDRWSGHVELLRNRRHVYAIEAWRDAFGSWRDGFRKKIDAGVAVPNEIEEGRLLL